MKKKRSESLLFFAPYLICFALFWLVPLVYGIYMSLCKFSLTKGNTGFVGLENYLKIFTPGSMYFESFFRGLRQSLLFVVGSVPLLVLVALALALIVDNLPARCRTFFRTIYFMSYAISVTAVAAIFKWLFNSNGGYVNNILLRLGILQEPVHWLEDQPFAWIVLILATVWWTVGYNMMLFINALNGIDPALHEAAEVDGANFWQRLWAITLPSIRSVTSYITLTSIIASFNMYGQSALITKGGPLNTTSTLIQEISNTIFNNNNLGVGNAMAITMGIIVMLMAMAQQYLQREKEDLAEVNGK